MSKSTKLENEFHDNRSEGHRLYNIYRDTLSTEVLNRLVHYYFKQKADKISSIIYNYHFSTLIADQVAGRFTEDMIKRLQREREQEYKIIEDFDRYFYKCLYNACNSEKKKNSSRRISMEEHCVSTVVRAKCSDQLEDDDLWKYLKANLLPITYKVMKLRAVGFKVGEIKTKLNISIGKVARHIAKGKAKINAYRQIHL